MANANDMLAFIAASPSPFHCVAEAARRLVAAGFTQVDEAEALPRLNPGDGFFIARGGTLIAWRGGAVCPSVAGFRLLGAHTDSPNLRIKPNPERRDEGYVRWAVEPYGGLLVATWSDRDLGLSGRVALRGAGGVETRLLRVDRPIARIPNIAIHLNRKVNDEGLKLNKQTELPPVVALGTEDAEGEELFRALVSQELAVARDDVLAWDLMLHDVSPPTIGGLQGEFVFTPRLDNQAMSYCAVEAILALGEDVPEATSVIMLFDHEECGSRSERGAESALGGALLRRIIASHASSRGGALSQATARSLMVSADMAHAVHPALSGRHDPDHKPRMNAGPVIKHNVNTRYATDSVVAARFKLACADVGAPVQEFVNRSDLTCGSTIGAISAAKLACPTVDVGCAMLSMHSIREQAGVADVSWMQQVMTRLLRDG